MNASITTHPDTPTPSGRRYWMNVPIMPDTWAWDEYDMLVDEAEEREVAERTLALHTCDSVHKLRSPEGQKLMNNIDELEELMRERGYIS